MKFAALRLCCQQIVVGTMLLSALPPIWAKPVMTPTPRLKYKLQQFGTVYAAAFSTDNKYLACASEGWPGEGEFTSNAHGLLTLWSVQTGHLIRRKLLLNQLYTLRFAPDGKTLVSIGYGDRNTLAGATKVQVWDTASLQLKKTLMHTENGGGIAFSSHSLLVAIGDGQEVILYSTRTWKRQRVLAGFRWGYLTNVIFSPDGTLIAGVSIASHTSSGELAVWNARSGRRRYWSGEDNPWDQYLDGPVAFLEKGQYLACGVMKLRMHPLSSHFNPVLPIWIKNQQDYDVMCLAYSTQNSPRAITACPDQDSILNIWDVSRRQRRCQLVGKMDSFLGLSLNGKVIAMRAGDIGTSAGAILQLWALP